MTVPYTRRQFVRLGAAGVTVLGLGACRRDDGDGPTGAGSSTSPTTGPGSVVPGSTVPTAPTGPAGAFGGRRLVLVQMNGGNDLLNALPPADGRYLDLRPTIGIPEAERVGLSGVTDAALHPALAPLVPAWDAGRLAVVRGVGFSDPDRSHFVSMDRWWRADDVTGPGWLGPALDGLGAVPPLFATAIGAGAPVLSGSTARATVVVSPSSFAFRGLDPGWLAMGPGTVGLDGAIRAAHARSVAAVADFARITAEASGPDDEVPAREGGATLAAGLEVAARLLVSDAGTQVVVVSASGFDTHAGQIDAQAALLADLAAGLVAFRTAVDDAGIGDDVLLVTTSEFGRRAAENGSGGTDHGAGGLTFVLGDRVAGGMYGEVDLGDLLDGDVRPVIDPLSLFTECLAWLGASDEHLPRRVAPLGLLR